MCVNPVKRPRSLPMQHFHKSINSPELRFLIYYISSFNKSCSALCAPLRLFSLLLQVGMFVCGGPVQLLEVNPEKPTELVCADRQGKLYFLSWKE